MSATRFRKQINSILDRLRFEFDMFPSSDYQPLPWLGKDRARFRGGAVDRWNALEPLLKELNVSSALDAGANVGYFSIRMARSDISTVAVESDPRCYRSLLYAKNKLDVRNLAVLINHIDRSTAQTLPTVDAVLFMSVWHNIIRETDLENATDILRALWEKCRHVLVFESIEVGMKAHSRLPAMDPSPEEFFRRYLGDTCSGCIEIRRLGRFSGFEPYGPNDQRTLWAVIRARDEGSCCQA